jgi:hypothetical protein
MPNDEKKLIGVIDLTPTWEAMIPLYVEILTNASVGSKARVMAIEELTRLAKIADIAIAASRHR